MLRGWITALMASALVLGCKTTSTEELASVDTVKGEVAIQTAADRRSSLENPASVESIRSAEARLKKETRQGGQVKDFLALAQIQLVQGKLDEAEASVREALKRDLKNQQARIVLAQIFLRRGNHDMAAIILNGLGGVQSKDSNVLNMLALVALERGLNDDAMALFQRSIKLDSRNLAARMNLGVLLLKYRQLSAAAVQFERVLKIMPEHRDAKLHMAIIHSIRGEADTAKKLLRDILRQDDKNPLALYNLVVVMQKTEDYDDALENLKAYLKSPRGKAEDNDQVFALIDRIQRFKAQGGEPVSDEEIQAMAANIGNVQEDEAPKRKVAVKPAAAKKAAPKVEAEPEFEPEVQPATYDYAADEGVDSAADDVSALEAELAK